MWGEFVHTLGEVKGLPTLGTNGNRNLEGGPEVLIQARSQDGCGLHTYCVCLRKPHHRPLSAPLLCLPFPSGNLSLASVFLTYVVHVGEGAHSRCGGNRRQVERLRFSSCPAPEQNKGHSQEDGSLPVPVPGPWREHPGLGAGQRWWPSGGPHWLLHPVTQPQDRPPQGKQWWLVVAGRASWQA